LCDLPFGRKFQAGIGEAALSSLYRVIAAEVLRVLRPGGRFVRLLPIDSSLSLTRSCLVTIRTVLLTSQTKALKEAFDAPHASVGHRWSRPLEIHYVKLGALDAWIHCATKEAVPNEQSGGPAKCAAQQGKKRKMEKQERGVGENDDVNILVEMQKDGAVERDQLHLARKRWYTEKENY